MAAKKRRRERREGRVHTKMYKTELKASGTGTRFLEIKTRGSGLRAVRCFTLQCLRFRLVRPWSLFAVNKSATEDGTWPGNEPERLAISRSVSFSHV